MALGTWAREAGAVSCLVLLLYRHHLPGIMGKKSRSKAAKSAACRSEQENDASSGSGTVVSSTRIGKQRCVNCCSTLKDISKAHACPGCSDLYCWRCEKKLFEGCPNGSRCAQPMRRCYDCAYGRTMEKQLGEAEKRDDGRLSFSHGAAALFMEHIEKDPRLSVCALPYRSCASEGCGSVECFQCLTDPSKVHALATCSLCHGNPLCQNCARDASLTVDVMDSAARRVIHVLGKTPSTGYDIKLAGKIYKEGAPRCYAACSICKINKFCIACLDDVSMERWVRYIFCDEEDFPCNTCYWSSKPCINPNCPNEPGVPTKRCGDCHLARYCSVECQAAAYPAHVGRCQKIKEKRVVDLGPEKNNER